MERVPGWWPVTEKPVYQDLGYMSYTASVNLRRKRLTVSGVLLGACLLSASTSGGQSSSGMEGTVLDISGGTVPGADVILFSDERVLTTKADEHGVFKFAPLPSGAHYIEASEPGFFSDSISLKDDTREVSFALEPATSGGVLLACFPSIPPTSVSYEERRGNAQLIGTVTEPLGSPVPHTSITLLRSDLDAPFDHGKNQSRHLGMKQRDFKESVAAQIDSDEKGEFQFAALESGWYTLTAAHEGHEKGRARFWVARETLTRVTRVNLFPRPLPEWPNCGRVPAPEKAKEQRP